MQTYRGRIAIGVFVVVACWSVAAQEGPRKTECRQWDEAYLTLFETFIAIAFASSTALALSTGLLGRRYWWAASPARRTCISTVGTFGTVAFSLEAWPRLIGFGSVWFSGIGPQYFDCQERAFNATGLFDGVIGANVPALAQWPAITAILLASALAGGTLAFVAGRLIVKFSGLAAKAKAGAL
ncbi:MAG TPA: hypothetical protein VFN10_15470 [Thermoanaerobaculia bacterium]|nr:hypothetical protein [Thermoanaerobaculia bacterium]